MLKFDDASLRELFEKAKRDDACSLFVPSDLRQMIGEIQRLHEALRPFAGLPEISEAETAVPNDSPVTIRCQLGDMRRAFKAINP